MIFQQSNVEMTASTKNYYIFCIAFIMLFYGVSVGINVTSFALFLHQMGLPKSQIGNVVAMELVGNLLIAPLFTKLCEKYGLFLIILVSLIVRNISIVAFPLAPTIPMNMLYMLTFGIGGFCLFAGIQYWGTSLLTDGTRTTMLALMNVAFRTGIALGVGFLFVKADKISISAFQTSALFASVIILPAFFIRESMPILNPKTRYTPPSKIIKYSIIAILCILVSNYVLTALNNFAIIYAIESNVEYRTALLINIYMVVGNLLFTIPIGFVLDRFKNKIPALIFTLIVMCIFVILIPFVINNHYLTIAIFTTISTGIGTIFVIGMSIVSAKFKQNNLATVNTIILIMNAVGGFAGVSTTGAAIEYWGNQGMIISVSVLILFFLLFIIYSLNNDE